ncbi:LysR family transcriptional regulator [Streptomyces sp. NRRL S-350]|uniref:LysR family transcriptional regulator n=1 Tax=Streptomyces sp. NRRL S-350 TaxID=1463902 RepID=UPI0007C51421|nr:LysR family transcriptional regulator [Streptomyces sp. NRRL S-350]
MDLDPAQLRAFLAVAEHRHFGRAAARLAITQQALSKRIARLEEALGERLLDRDGGRGAVPTAAGERLLEPARAVLAACEAAVVAVHGAARPLRLDVWGHLFAPLRTVGALDVDPLPLEIGHGRDLPSVLGALLRGETDAGFGRYHALPDGREHELAHRLVRLEPVDAVLGAGHPLAGADALRPDDLRTSRLLLPAALARLEFLQRFAERFGLTTLPPRSNLGVEHFLTQLATTPDAVTLLPADAPLPDLPGLRTVPLVDPTPLYAWSLVWPKHSPHPRLPALLRAFADTGRRNRWLEYRPDRDWLPEAEDSVGSEVPGDSEGSEETEGAESPDGSEGGGRVFDTCSG